MRVLVAEDDQRTADCIVRGLTESGHVVDCVADDDAALAMASEGIYEALVLDRKLPGLDGLAVVRHLHRRDRRILVLMLSGFATTAARVEGLQAGCDDYLAKPYSFSELLARLEALARRTGRSRRQSMLRIGDLGSTPKNGAPRVPQNGGNRVAHDCRASTRSGCRVVAGGYKDRGRSSRDGEANRLSWSIRNASRLAPVSPNIS